jgi:GTP-binding protein Era
MTPKTRCGYVSIIGAPNAGKSTLINQLVGAKVSIVSPKVQTTRTRVTGIVVKGDAQVIFVDTPGIFAPKKRLEKAMVSAAWQGTEQTDIILLLLDVSKGRFNDDALQIIDRLKKSQRKAIAVFNKVDLVAKERLLSLAARVQGEGIFTDVYMISALNGDGVEKMLNDLAARMPPGPFLFDPDQMTDMPLRLLAAEITREKIFLQLGDELPYASTVETDLWAEEGQGVSIEQTIYVMRDTQKAIVLGAGGQRIKKIGTDARLELEAILEKRVHLKLFVKVRDNWADDRERYAPWGLDFEAK